MKTLVLIFFMISFYSCVDNSKSNPGSEKHDFFPVNSFLKGQIYQVDSFKLPTRRYHTVNDKTDTALISLVEFDSLAKAFLDPDINDPSINQFYKETSFADQSIPSVTFTYSTNNKNLSLQRMDIIVNPDPVLNDQVKSIYLEKIDNNGDTIFVKKLFWKTNKYFQIISVKQAVGQPAVVSRVKVAWSATD